ncbi:MAG TPA: DNA-binding protein [Patescibacteria group bacterium]|nr:DNA-binding protein [Patescibacteria group bacterium]
MPKNYTVKEVADILGFSTNSIYAFLKEKRIKGVRIGRGRFRIPEEELARILHLSKKPQSVVRVSVGSPAPVLMGDAQIILDEPKPSLMKFGELLAPNIFDWFIGLAAVIAGFGMFVFNVSFGSSEIASTPLIFPIIRLVLIACGMGIIISSMYFQGRGWHNVFHLCLSLLGFINAFGLMRSGDMEGALLYGLLGLTIGINHLLRLGGIVTIMIYATSLAFAYPLVIVFIPGDIHVQALTASLGMSPVSIGLLGLAVSITLVAGLWMGYARQWIIFFVAAWSIALFDMAVAVWYAHMLYWSRAFFFVVVGYFTGMLPHWWPLQQSVARRYKYMLHAIFAGIGAAMFIAVLIVYLLQQNVWDARERELASKLTIAQTRIENAVTSVRSSALVASVNTDFVAVVMKRDTAKLYAYAKIIYESNPNIRRLIFLDEAGDSVGVYPYGTLDDPNYAYRDYFQKAKATGQPVISDVFQARADNAGRYVLVVSVPLRDVKGAFAGVMAASLDLDRMGLILDQVATSERGEHFVIADAKGVILSHPNASLIGSTAPLGDPLYLGISGKQGVVDGIMIEKSPGMIAYTDIPALRWGLSLRVPSRNVFELTSFAIWAVFGLVGCMLFVGIGMFRVVQMRINQSQGSGSG